MKKCWIASICVLAIAVPICCDAMPEPARGPRDVAALWEGNGENTSIISQCAWQGGLVLLAQGEGLLHYLPQTEELNKILAWEEAQGISWLAADDQNIWGYDSASMTLRLLLSQAGEANMALALADHPMDESQGFASQPEQLFISGRHLYALFRPEAFNGYKTRLAAWQLADGKRADVRQPEHLQAVSAYQDGTLAGLAMHAWAAANTPDETARRPRLVVFDPQSGQEQELGMLNEPVQESNLAFAWDETSDGVYYNNGNKLYYRNGQGREALHSYLGSDVFIEGAGNRLVPLPERQCAVLGFDSRLMLHSAARDGDLRPLVIYGLMSQDKAHFEALEKIKGTGVEYLDRKWDDDTDLLRLLQGGAADVLFLRSDWDEAAKMVDKGYLMDLSRSPALSAHLKRCYPFLQEEAAREEGFFLLPVSMDAMVHQVKPEKFEALGLAVPETFDALCAFLEAWERDEMEERTNALPYSAGDPRDEMLRQARMLGLFSQAFQRQEIRFDTPLTRRLLARASALGLDRLVKPPDDTGWYHQEHLISYAGYSLTGLTLSAMDNPLERTVPLLVKPSPGETGVVPCRVGYLAVSAGTKNPEAALLYAEQYVSSLHASAYVQLFPGENTPVESPGVREHIESLLAEEQGLLGRIESAQGAEIGKLNEQLSVLRQRIAQQEATRYLVSPGVIAQYRRDMQTAFVLNRDLERLLNGKEFTQPYERWRQGQLSLDDFLLESDRKLKLMRLEND